MMYAHRPSIVFALKYDGTEVSIKEIQEYFEHAKFMYDGECFWINRGSGKMKEIPIDSYVCVTNFSEESEIKVMTSRHFKNNYKLAKG